MSYDKWIYFCKSLHRVFSPSKYNKRSSNPWFANIEQMTDWMSSADFTDSIFKLLDLTHLKQIITTIHMSLHQSLIKIGNFRNVQTLKSPWLENPTFSAYQDWILSIQVARRNFYSVLFCCCFHHFNSKYCECKYFFKYIYQDLLHIRIYISNLRIYFLLVWLSKQKRRTKSKKYKVSISTLPTATRFV